MIDDSLGLRFEPEFIKISAVYVIIASVPENWLRNIKNMVFNIALIAGLVALWIKKY